MGILSGCPDIGKKYFLSDCKYAGKTAIIYYARLYNIILGEHAPSGWLQELGEVTELESDRVENVTNRTEYQVSPGIRVVNFTCSP